jgi:hypothetical protein
MKLPALCSIRAALSELTHPRLNRQRPSPGANMKIRMLEMIRTPFLAAKGEIKDVHDDVAIELERHGHAELVLDADEVELDFTVGSDEPDEAPKKSKATSASKKHSK